MNSNFKCNTKKVTPIYFETEDNKKYTCKFNNKAFAIMDEENKEGCILLLSKSLLKPYLNGTKIIYAGLKACDNEMTMQIAENIAYSLELEQIQEVIKMALENFKGNMDLGKQQVEITPQTAKLIQRILMN